MEPREFKITFMLSLVLGYFCVEMFVGYRYNSLALVADACHMLSDGLCLVVALGTVFSLNRSFKKMRSLFTRPRQKAIAASQKMSTFFNLLKTYFKVAIKVAKRSNHEQVMKADNTFGWARAEIIGGLTNAIFLLALCVIIILESIEKL